MDFIIEFNNSIPDLLCDNIINLYEETNDKYAGQTLGGVQLDIKNTTDFIIPQNNNKWEKIEKFLYKELIRKLVKYIEIIDKKLNINENNYDITFSLFDNKNLFTESFMIQKYDKSCGKYVYHNDFSLHYEKEKSYRVLTFLWYLNDVTEGGETAFWNDYKIIPEKGKLLLFPASWSYPHSGKMPISNDKYIITGWLYILSD